MRAGAGLASPAGMNPQPSMLVLLEHVHQHGLADRMAAARALLATLRMLGERLHDVEAAALARALPHELQRVIEETEYDSDFDASEAYRRLGRAMGIPQDEARAQSDIVMRALGELISGDLVTRLERVLPERLTRSLRPVDHDADSPYRASGIWRTSATHSRGHHPSR